jgi:hypothetical protein
MKIHKTSYAIEARVDIHHWKQQITLGLKSSANFKTWPSKAMGIPFRK